MTTLERFTNLIETALDRSSAQTPNAPLDQCLLEVEGRSFHFSLIAERGDVVISTLVFVNDRDPRQIHADLIAGFNAFHLLQGGYRLCVDPETLCLYVSVNRSLDALEKSGLRVFLLEFIERCMTCTRWYMDECSRRLAESIKPEAAMAL